LERNIYLPQPNYVVLAHGKPIDVLKIEEVEIAAGLHRLYWKTLSSPNGSATFDDGIATFERRDGGTNVVFVGKQRFTLPPVLQMLDEALPAATRAGLVTDAYRRFFDGTVANLEALVEGRDIFIGKRADEDSDTVDPIYRSAGRLAQKLQAAATGLLLPKRSRAAVQAPVDTDEDGFAHFGGSTAPTSAPPAEPQESAWTVLLLGYLSAVLRDASLRRR
jgi:hypothetical protein